MTPAGLPSARRLAAPCLAAAAAFVVALAACGKPSSGPAGPARDPYDPEVPTTAPTGAPVGVAWDGAPPGPQRVTGTWRFAHAVTGRTGPQKVAPSRRGEGRVDLVDSTVLRPDGVRVTEAKGAVRLATERGEVEVPLEIRFEHDEKGGARRNTLKVTLARGADTLRADMETLVGAFADRFRLPGDAVRVGQAFAPPDAMALEETLQRPLFFLFQRRAVRGDPVNAPLVGKVWPEALETWEGTEVLRTRIAVVHAFEGDTDPTPDAKDSVHVAYRAAIEGVRRVATADGLPRSHDLALRRRFSFRAPDLDYAIESVGEVSLRWTPVPP